jgi:protein gp37
MLLMGYRNGQTEGTPCAFEEATEDVIESVLGWSKLETFLSNVWIGVSAGADQAAALKIPAKIHFLSCEPMLKPLDHYYLPTQEFDWIIFGGESGKNARLCNVDWIRDGIAFCKRLQIACFVKQLGANIVDNTVITPPGKLKDSHGGDWAEWPEELMVREFP